MKKLFLSFLMMGVLVMGNISPILAADDMPVPRVVFALYDSKVETMPRYSLVHRVLEMPMNWLGYHLEYHDIHTPLPVWREEVAGLVLWLPSGVYVEDQPGYVNWIQEGMNSGKKLIIMGNPGFNAEWRDTPEGHRAITSLLARIGVRETGQWQSLTYHTRINYKHASMTEFERRYEGVLPGYYRVSAMKEASVYLKVQDKDDNGQNIQADLVMVHPNGGYIAEGYGFYYELDKDNEHTLAQRWLIDPFRFLDAVFASQQQPRPDVSTLWGKRIFYSHADGDGWNNITEIPKYQMQKTISAEVLLKEIYEPYQQLGFTVAPIVAEVDPGCYGYGVSPEIVRHIFALPNVEPASHTYSHPLHWRYFEDGNAAKELRFIDRYPPRPDNASSIYDAVKHMTGKNQLGEAWQEIIKEYRPEELDQEEVDIVTSHFDRPRSYACEPFDIQKEIKGSVDYLQKLAPLDKQIRLIQWSGDTSPAENALAEVRKHQLLNINGGDSRFDPDYPSYSYVAPLGLKVGKERQIYSSNSNENTYTNLWSERFFGFRHLVNTVKNTETPKRVSPFNIYYHTYSAEKQPSLEALKKNIGFALTQDIIPIFASEYAEIAEGYFSTQFKEVAENRWEIINRGALQTIRFDRATLLQVDMAASKGVIGQHPYQGSLYVFLNPAVETPVIALKEHALLSYPYTETKPYLISSRWNIRSFRHIPEGFRIKAKGFGSGVMQFYWPYGQKAELRLYKGNKLLRKQLVNVKKQSVLTLVLDDNALKPVTIEVVASPDV